MEDWSLKFGIYSFPEVLPVYDLQRFAAEDEGRTELPSDRRKREEREKGNVPRSQDIVQSAVLIGSVLILYLFSGFIFKEGLSLFKKYLDQDYNAFSLVQSGDVKRMIFDIFFDAGKITAPVLIATVIMSLIANIAQVGFLFTAEPLSMKFERLMPDFKRVLPNRRTFWTLGKTFLQFLVIAGASYLIIVDDFIPMLKSSGMGTAQAISLFSLVTFKLLLVAGIIFLILSVPDYLFQRFEYLENLKMTPSEMKRERRDDDGDPMIKQRQRERAYQMRQQRNMLKDVARADVVITNPTHYAVALGYDPMLHQAPMVLAKGTDHFALLIRRIAKENHVTIQENPPLARVLYAEVEVGKEIPQTLYQVVSQIFAKLESFRRKTNGA